MKLLCLLFAMCVVLLSVRPCCADDECIDECVAAQQHTNNKQRDKECRGCSPFFSCGSCAGFTINKHYFAVLVIAPLKTGQIYPPYRQPNLQNIIQTIWQPPQLA